MESGNEDQVESLSKVDEGNESQVEGTDSEDSEDEDAEFMKAFEE